MATTYYLAQRLLNHVLLGPLTSNPSDSFPQPPNVYVGLFTSMPSPNTDLSPGIEVVGGGYSRLEANFSQASSNRVSNSIDLGFNIASTSWGDVVGFGIFDARTGGNLLYFSALSETKTVYVGDIVRFPKNSLVVTCN